VDQICLKYPTGYRVAERLVIPKSNCVFQGKYPIRDAEYHSLIAEHLPKFYTDSNRTGSWRLQTCLSINNLPAFLHVLKPDAKTQKCYHARLALLKAYRRELKASKAPKVVKPTKPINPEGPPLPLNGHWLRSERRRLHRSSSKICQALGVKESVLLAIEENGTMLLETRYLLSGLDSAVESHALLIDRDLAPLHRPAWRPLPYMYYRR